jgi:hypothetical protein
MNDSWIDDSFSWVVEGIVVYFLLCFWKQRAGRSMAFNDWGRRLVTRESSRSDSLLAQTHGHGSRLMDAAGWKYG